MKIKIYNLNGKLIRLLENKVKALVTYKVIFDGKNKDRLYHWADDRNIPAENNRSERELRRLVISRKISLIFLLYAFSLNCIFPQEWVYQNSNTTVNLNDIFFVDHYYGWAVGDSSIIIHTNDGGNNWEVQDNPVDSITFEKVQFLNNDVGYIVGTNGTILSTTDGGEIWKLNNSGVDYLLLGLSFINDDTGWVSGGDFFGERERGIILHTVNGGETWDIQFETYSPSYFSSKMFSAVEFTDEQNGWAFASDYVDNFSLTYIYRTINSGENWDTAGVAGTPLFDLDVLGDTIWAGGWPSFAVSNNSGLDWIYNPWQPSDIVTVTDFKLLNGHSGWVLGATLSGSVLLFTDNNWMTWSTVLSDRIPWLNSIFTLGLDEIWVAGDSGTVMYYNSDPVEVDNDKNNIPNTFKLFQNYPNPFNPVTTIQYNLPVLAYIQLKVYDILGNEVIRLVDGEIDHGNYSVIWNGKNNLGINVPSGIYFCSLKYNGISQVKKMFLIR